MQKDREQHMSIQSILQQDGGLIKDAIDRVEKELQILKSAITYSVDEIVGLIQEDPRFIEKMKDSALKSPAFKKAVFQELLNFLEQKYAGISQKPNLF